MSLRVDAALSVIKVIIIMGLFCYGLSEQRSVTDIAILDLSPYDLKQFCAMWASGSSTEICRIVTYGAYRSRNF